MEYKDEVKSMSLWDLYKECIYYANDGYFGDLFEIANAEMLKRLLDIPDKMEERENDGKED